MGTTTKTEPTTGRSRGHESDPEMELDEAREQQLHRERPHVGHQEHGGELLSDRLARQVVAGAVGVRREPLVAHVRLLAEAEGAGHEPQKGQYPWSHEKKGSGGPDPFFAPPE